MKRPRTGRRSTLVRALGVAGDGIDGAGDGADAGAEHPPPLLCTAHPVTLFPG